MNIGFFFSWSRWTERHYKRHFRDTVLLGELFEMRKKNHYNQLLDDIPPDFHAENCINFKIGPENRCPPITNSEHWFTSQIQVTVPGSQIIKRNSILGIRHERPFTQEVLQVSHQKIPDALIKFNPESHSLFVTSKSLNPEKPANTDFAQLLDVPCAVLMLFSGDLSWQHCLCQKGYHPCQGKSMCSEHLWCR